MRKTYVKLLILMAMAAALIGCPPTEEAVKISFSANGGVGTMADQVPTEESEPWRIRMRQSEWRRR